MLQRTMMFILSRTRSTISPYMATRRKGRFETTFQKFGMPCIVRVSAKRWYCGSCAIGSRMEKQATISEANATRTTHRKEQIVMSYVAHDRRLSVGFGSKGLS